MASLPYGQAKCPAHGMEIAFFIDKVLNFLKYEAMNMGATAIDAKILLLEKKKNVLQDYLHSVIQDILERKKRELRELGIDVERKDVSQFIDNYRKTQMEALGKAELQKIDNEIRKLRIV